MDKTIGVLGGMGPEATVAFFGRLVAATPAEKDQDHFRVVIVNDPRIPDRGAYLEGRGESPVPALLRAARDLERMGVDLIAIPCNTAHAFLGEIREAVAVPVLDIVAETVAALAVALPPAGSPKVGVMATRSTVRLRLYQNALAEKGFEPLEPDEETQSRVSETIANLKGSRDLRRVGQWMDEAVARFAEQGASALIYGCTELCLAPVQPRLPIFDSTAILAVAAVREASGAE